MSTSRRRATDPSLKTDFSEGSHCQTLQKYKKSDFEDKCQLKKFLTNLRQLENDSFIQIRTHISHNPLSGIV